MLRFLPALLPLAVCAACAPMEDQPETAAETSSDIALAEEGADCFFPRTVNGYHDAPDGPRGEERIFVEAGSEKYLFEVFGSCPAIDYTLRLGLQHDGVGPICRGVDVDLVIPDSTMGPRECPVRMIRKVVEDDYGET